MSGRLASTSRRDRRAVARGACGALCALACVLLAGPPGAVRAQPKPPTKPEDAAAGDTRSPLPADRPGRQPHADFAVPAPDRLVFAKIEDFKPVASEAENKGEYDAWCEVVSHAKRFETAALEAHAARDLSVVELVKPVRTLFRTELLRFDGQVLYVRRLRAPKFFTDNPGSGVKELYEARIVPTDESPLAPVSVVFLDLPAAFAAAKSIPAGADKGEWLDLKEPKRYVSAAGFYFKTMNVPGEAANAVVGVPVLIGKSVTPLPGEPVAPGPDPTALDPDVRVFKFVRDETEMNRPGQWEEAAAFNRVLMHAHRFTPEQLEAAAPPPGQVKFADLFLDVRTAYKLKIVRFEGRLIRLKRTDVSADLRAAGVEHLFEGWLVPAGEPRGNPVCVVFTETLAGVEPADRVNVWVSFAGFSFKKMRYESAEEDPKAPKRNLHKLAPLLIGKSPVVRREPAEPSDAWATFVLWVLVGGLALIASAGLLAWYYRGGDRRARRAMDAVRGRNPFDAPAAPAAPAPPPPVRPANDWTGSDFPN